MTYPANMEKAPLGKNHKKKMAVRDQQTIELVFSAKLRVMSAVELSDQGWVLLPFTKSVAACVPAGVSLFQTAPVVVIELHDASEESDSGIISMRSLGNARVGTGWNFNGS